MHHPIDGDIPGPGDAKAEEPCNCPCPCTSAVTKGEKDAAVGAYVRSAPGVFPATDAVING